MGDAADTVIGARSTTDSDEHLRKFILMVSLWNDLHDVSRIPPLLYHYTSFSGMVGILKDNALRATYSKTLNDGSEWDFGKQIVAKYAIPTGLAEEFPVPEELRTPPPISMFVTCFCEEGNLLSMWRSYTAQGGGYCLGFDGPQIAELQRVNLENRSFAARIVKMAYGAQPTGPMEALLKAGGHLWAEWVLENMIKHKGFEEEREWRIIVPDPPVSLMSFHEGSATIKAAVHVRHRSGKLPLRAIHCGPTVRPEAQAVVKWMLEQHGYPGVEVTGCDIPYRF